ncbi:MAG: hypothetical protein GX913_08280 [Clostridiales bacterium]|nr:hypothetical protein [Clostridiales bacterium]
MERDCKYPKMFLCILWINEKSGKGEIHLYPGEIISLSYYFDKQLQMKSVRAISKGYEGYFDGHTTSTLLKARKKGILYQCFYYKKNEDNRNVVIIIDLESDIQISDFVELNFF